MVAGVAVLAAVVLVASDIKIPGSGLTATVTDSISTDTTLTDSAPAPVEPAPADSAPVAPIDLPIFQDILQVFLPPLSIENPVPAAPKGASHLKVFVLAQDALESTVNEWLAVQQNIIVDQLNVEDYGGGGYLVVISYHTGGTGSSSTRLKIIEGENSEADAQAFLSSLGASQTVRSVAATTGSYSGSEITITVPIIFIVYE